MQTEASLRQELLRISHLLYKQGLVAGSTGSLSVQLSDGEILCTTSRSHKGLLTDEDLLVIDMQGNPIRGEGEVPAGVTMHLACYQSRKDVRAVVYSQPQTCMAFTLAGLVLDSSVLPNVVATLSSIVTLPYQTLGTNELSQQVGDAIAHKDVVLLERQGAVSVGVSLLDALCRQEEMEQLARIIFQAKTLRAVTTIEPNGLYDL